MVQLWYDNDEVRCFHPLVEKSLKEILGEEGFDEEYAVKHHPNTPGSTKTPDFSVYKKRSQRTVFILEVKRTERDVDSQTYWNQTSGYVRDLTHSWEPGHKYFAITNIEKTIAFCDREGPDVHCVLAGNPLMAGKFSPDTHDATEVVSKFKSLVKDILIAAIKDEEPKWADAWQPIIDSFTENLRSSVHELSKENGEELGKEISTYELLRIFLYYFISSYYIFTKSEKAKYFRINRLDPNTSLAFQQTRTNYARARDLDFKQIFSDSPITEARIDIKQFRNIKNYFNSFVETLQSFIVDAVQQSHSPEYFFNLLTANLYDHEELHREGKVMSDSELAGLLAELCIDKNTEKVLDPGCGDGALLEAAYDKLQEIKSQANPALSHQDILNHLDGIEIDPFLTQLAAFRLLMKSPHEVNETTEVDILTSDVFDEKRNKKYDVVLMNPPYLRNEESVQSLMGSSQGEMLTAIKAVKEEAFVSSASQPNLYFYFVNYAHHYLNDAGKMGVILMAKFMNNKDGVYLKEFMKDKVEAVISYPKGFFHEFKVTTTIVILSKKPKNNNVKFLNLRAESLLSNAPKVKDILSTESTAINADYSLKVIERNQLDPSSNWRIYLLDPEDKYLKIKALKGFTKLSNLFDTIKRGGAANNGAVDMIFPSQRSKIELARRTPSELLCFGINRNKGYKYFILDESELSLQPAINFPARYDTNTTSGYDPAIGNDFLEELYEIASRKYANWTTILNGAYESKVAAQIIIPRADRTKHAIYYNATGQKVVISTNFIAFSNYRNNTHAIANAEQIKFICAFMLSSFGQIQFELIANDQEGMRKIEAFMLEKLTVIDPQGIPAALVNSVVEAFEELNNTNSTFAGVEVTDNPRQKLDESIAQVLLHMGMNGFENADKLVKFAQLFLADLVQERQS
jgi:type I restriction-modification system DNA methylase subunit